MFHSVRRRLPLLLLAWTAGASLAAPPAPLQEQDLKNFVAAYRVAEATRLLLEEAGRHQVETGRLSPDMAACIRDQFPYAQLHRVVAPIAKQAFGEAPEHLHATTAFLQSDLGRHLMDATLVLQREQMWRQNRGLPEIPAGWPASFRPEDVRRVEEFTQSPAGRTFAHFSTEWLPQMQSQDLWRKTQETCAQSGVSTVAPPPAPRRGAQEWLPGRWRQQIQWRLVDGRAEPPLVVERPLFIEYRADGTWETRTLRHWQQGRFRWIEGGRIEETVQASSMGNITPVPRRLQARADGQRLELVQVIEGEQLDNFPTAQSQPRPKQVVIVNIFRREAAP